MAAGSGGSPSLWRPAHSRCFCGAPWRSGRLTCSASARQSTPARYRPRDDSLHSPGALSLRQTGRCTQSCCSGRAWIFVRPSARQRAVDQSGLLGDPTCGAPPGRVEAFKDDLNPVNRNYFSWAGASDGLLRISISLVFCGVSISCPIASRRIWSRSTIRFAKASRKCSSNPFAKWTAVGPTAVVLGTAGELPRIEAPP